jgi:glycosyltransferase involved in cell wall biosynthesis
LKEESYDLRRPQLGSLEFTKEQALRIAHVIRTLDQARGGVVRAVLDLGNATADYGAEVTLLTTAAPDAEESWLGRGTRRALRVFEQARFATELRRVVGSFEIVHIHEMWTATARHGVEACRALGVPYVISTHGMLDDWCMAQRGIKKRIYLATRGRHLFSSAAAVHTTAGAESDQARKWLGGARLETIPLVLDLSPYENLPGPEPARGLFDPGFINGRPVVLYLARLHEKKGVDLFLHTIAALRESGVDCVAPIAGSAEEPAYEARMRSLADQLGLDDSVVFLGMVRGEEKTSLFQLADVYLSPTSQENFGLVFPESLACETPVVTTRGVDIHPELTSSGGAIIVDRDVPSLTEAVAGLIADPDRARSMGRLGREWVFSSLRASLVIKRYIKLYSELIG